MTIETQVDSLAKTCVRTEAILEDLVKVVGDHEKRIRWVERVVSYGSGIAFALYFIANNYPLF